ncbi:unnamed protein product, partial [Urochloa humidicola]
GGQRRCDGRVKGYDPGGAVRQSEAEARRGAPGRSRRVGSSVGSSLVENRQRVDRAARRGICDRLTSIAGASRA